MKDDVKKAVEYELLLRSKISSSLMPFGIGFMLFMAGVLSLIPVESEDGDIFIFVYFMLLSFLAVDFYMKMLLHTGENMKSVNVFTKFRMVPVKREFLIKGKVYLLTRFVIRCTLVFQMLNLLVRVIADAKILCIEATLPTLVMLIIYIFERIQLHFYARKLNR